MNGPLLRRTLGSNALRLVLIAVGLAVMGVIMPVMYAAFGREMAAFLDSVPMLGQLASSFEGGDFLSLNGSLAFAFAHPFTLLLVGIMAIAFPALAIAGEREKGTLEVTLSRPISRRGLLATLGFAGIVFVTLLVAVLVASTGLTAAAVGFAAEVEPGHLLQLGVVTVLFFLVFMAFAFVVSVESDRAAPAVGIPAVFMLANYLAHAIGGLWPDVAVIKDWSLFNLLKPQPVLVGGAAPGDIAVMIGLIAAFAALAFVRFPRRDLPAPS